MIIEKAWMSINSAMIRLMQASVFGGVWFQYVTDTAL